MIGREQRFNPSHSPLEKAYIHLFGVPIIGLRIRARNIEKLVPPGIQPTRILDAGSGPGVITFLLANKFPKAVVTGIDMAQEEIRACEAIAKKANIHNARFQIADIKHLPWKDHFDLIVCVDILEHIENDAGAVAKLAEILAPKGTLILHVPALYRKYPFFKERVNFEVPDHVRPGYEKDSIKNLVSRAGLRIEKCGFTYGFLETLANNLSYLITRAEKKNKSIYAFAFPFLNLLSFLGTGARPEKSGAGIFILASKKLSP